MWGRCLWLSYYITILYKCIDRAMVWFRVTDICVCQLNYNWFEWWLFASLALSERNMSYCYFDLWFQISVIFGSIYNSFNASKIIRKCNLQMATILFRPQYFKISYEIVKLPVSRYSFRISCMFCMYMYIGNIAVPVRVCIYGMVRISHIKIFNYLYLTGVKVDSKHIDWK